MSTPAMKLVGLYDRPDGRDVLQIHVRAGDRVGHVTIDHPGHSTTVGWCAVLQAELEALTRDMGGEWSTQTSVDLRESLRRLLGLADER